MVFDASYLEQLPRSESAEPLEWRVFVKTARALSGGTALRAIERWRQAEIERARRAAEAIRLIEELAAARRALREGDKQPIWDFFKGYVGQRPDSLTRTVVPNHVSEGEEDFEPRPLLLLLKVHGARIAAKVESSPESIAEQAANVLRGISRRYPSVRLALAIFLREVGKGQEHKDRAIVAVATELEARLSPGDNLSGKVASLIRAELFERPDEPTTVFALDPEKLAAKLAVLTDEFSAATFADMERAARKVAEADLSQQELESWALAVLLSDDGGRRNNKAAAAESGRCANQVAQENFRADKKIKKARRAV